MKISIMIPLQIICSIFSFFLLTASNAYAVVNDNAIDNYSFNLKIGELDIGSIISVAGLSIRISANESGNDKLSSMESNTARAELGAITLNKRFIANSIFNDWIEKTLRGNIKHHHRNIIITLIGHSKTKEDSYIIQQWKLHRCLPTLWKLSPLSMESNEELTEQLSVKCERLEEDNIL